MTEPLIDRAFDMIKPIIESLIAENQDSDGIHIVLVAGKYEEGVDVKQNIDWENTFGHPVKETNSEAIAMAQAAWRLNDSSRYIGQNRRKLLETGDSPRIGAVCDTSEKYPLVVSTCGLSGNRNEYVSLLLMVTIHLLIDEAADDLIKNGGVV